VTESSAFSTRSSTSRSSSSSSGENASRAAADHPQVLGHAAVQQRGEVRVLHLEPHSEELDLAAPDETALRLRGGHFYRIHA
jgi:hypothetical protein